MNTLYVIVVYDIEVNRIDKVRKLLRAYLFWIQNSVFEGELTEASYKSMVMELKRMIRNDYDSVVIFKFNSKKSFNREVLGVGLDDNGFVV